MNDTFWIGVYPGLTEEMLDFVAAQDRSLFRREFLTCIQVRIQ